MRSSARFSEELGQFVGAKLVNEYPDGVGENPVLPEGKIIGISSFEQIKDFYQAGVAADIQDLFAPGRLYLIEQSTLPSSNEYGYFNGTNYRLFNSGDIDIPFEVIIPLSISDKGMLIQLSRDNSPKKRLQLKISKAKSYNNGENDEYINLYITGILKPDGMEDEKHL